MTKPNYKVIALDLDGTILNSDKKVSENSKRVLQYLTSPHYKNENGDRISILLASGRAPYLVKPVEEQLGIDCSLIGYNGGLCLSTQEEGRVTVFSRSISNIHLQKIFKYVDQHNLFLNVYGDQFVYGISKPELRSKPEQYASMTGATYKFFDHYSDLSTDFTPSKCLIILDTNEEADQLLETLKPLFPEIGLVKSNCHSKDYKQYYVEFVQLGVNKGSAISDFCATKNFTVDQVVAFGDAENDIEMLQTSGLGICLANGTTPTKKIAKLVSQFSNDDDGVARELVKLFNLPLDLIK
eukprot:gene861-1075_t